jgi:ABC-2 type transport system permease protein
MTASTITDDRRVAVSSSPRFAGLGALVRKDVTEWGRGRRGWVVFTVTTLFMVLSAANAWIITQLAAVLPADAAPEELPTSMAAIDNLLAAVGPQIFVFAAIFAVASLIVRERESGTLAWVASKPVSRSSIWVAKWISASGMLVLSAVLAPFLVTVAAVIAMYGMPDLTPVALLTVGASAAVMFYAALGLAAGTILPGQPAIVAVGFAVYAVVPAVLGLLPVNIAPFLPTSILAWTAAVAGGQDAGWVTPVAWAVGTALLAGFAVQRMRRMEL